MSLPAGAIALRSYRTVLGNPRALARCAAMPAAVWLAGNVLLLALEGSLASGPDPVPLTGLVLEWGPGLSFSIAWLRWILGGERRPLLAAPRFGRRELAGLVFSVVLPLAAVAPFVVPLALGVAIGAGPAANVIVTALVVLAALWTALFALRVMLVFPLVALDAAFAALPRSWDATRGHALALLALFLLTVGPPTAVQALAALPFDDAPGVQAWASLLLDVVLYFPVNAIGLTAGALAARALGAVPASTERGPEQPTEPATAS
jgi:hypothetical protein